MNRRSFLSSLLGAAVAAVIRWSPLSAVVEAPGMLAPKAAVKVVGYNHMMLSDAGVPIPVFCVRIEAGDRHAVSMVDKRILGLVRHPQSYVTAEVRAFAEMIVNEPDSPISSVDEIELPERWDIDP